MSKIFEHWNDVDELCPNCGNIKKRAIGITRQNLKYLIWHKPTLIDWVLTFFFVFLILTALAYKSDVGVCQDFIKDNNLSALFYNVNLTNSTLNPFYNFSIAELGSNEGKMDE